LDLRKVIISIRKQKLPDPAEFGNAGSFFKNPEIDQSHFQELQRGFPDLPSFPAEEGKTKIPAAWLIERAGWKNRRIGNVGTWPAQPLVIVNYGGATGQDILDFSKEIRMAVEQKFGIMLEPEVNIIG
jgi:UDP-N-acetylmuramate dehydrogenase